MLGSMSALRTFSNQVEKQEDAGQDDVQQQMENDEVSVADGGEDANEPPLSNTNKQHIHEMFMQRYGPIKLRKMPSRML